MGTYATVYPFTEDEDSELTEIVSDLYRGDSLFTQARIRLSSTEELSHVAVRDGEIVGAACFGTSGNDATFSVVTDPTHSRNGVARSLVEAVIEHFREVQEPMELWQLRAWVVNPDAMIPLLESLGFDCEGSEWTPDSPHMTLS